MAPQILARLRPQIGLLAEVDGGLVVGDDVDVTIDVELIQK